MSGQSKKLPRRIVNTSLGENQVHIWKLRVSNSNKDTEELYKNVLSQDEKERADRLRFTADRVNFVLSRGHLRGLLSRYINLPAADIEFKYNSYGKPYLNIETYPQNIKFNISHSNDIAIYALALASEVGVDVEYIREVKRAGKIIERFFSDEERAFYQRQPAENKMESFFRLWCRREAYAKARGYGLNLPKGDIQISLVPGEGGYKNHTKDSGGAGASLHDFPVDAGYVAALTVCGGNPEILYGELNETGQ